MLKRFGSFLLAAGALVATAPVALAGYGAVEPESNGGDGAAIIVALAIGAILIAALNTGPKPDPETTDSDE